jgi:hypothetical protein
MQRPAVPVVLALLAAAATAAVARPAAAAPILVPDATLAAKQATYERQEDTFSTRENGVFLDTIVKAADVATVKAFFAQTQEPDFQKLTGRHPYDVVEEFTEYGDEGNFAGIGSVGIGARLLALRAAGAPAAEVTRARDAAIRAARTWHVYGTIGGPGVIARGVRKLTPNAAGEPGSPGAVPTLTPLKDANGGPLPAEKGGVWRAPIPAELAGTWIWMDDTSKDQVSGYVLGALWLWDALKGDPAAPQDVLDPLAADMTALAKTLMKVAPEYDIDLCLRDADGRLTGAHDLNARQVVPDAVIPESVTLRNGFNAAMALGVIRAAYHMGGDPDVGRYYYEELVGHRNYPKLMAENAGFIFLGAPTNFSNVNMLAISLALLGRTETDPYVRGKLDETLQKQFWSTGDPRDVSHVKQAWFDAVYGAYAASPAAGLGARIQECLSGFQDAPAFNRDRVNCDDQEIAAGKCLAVDGVTTIVLASSKGHGGSVVAKDLVPWSIRPDSDFEWRSDPFEVNGNASTLMNAGGDFLAALWLARASDTDTTKNVSPYARPALAYTFSDVPADDADAGAPAASPGKSGCSNAPRADGSAPLGFATFAAAALGLGLAARRRRRGRSQP